MPNPANTILPAGYAFVTNRAPVKLRAFLGTCLGVAAYDPDAGVGGMIHLLLPEPVGELCEQPERYALTGMPRFLQALYQAGATSENLRAVLAGGALVGPLQEIDLMLNIGGRTAEVVRNILSEEGIVVEHNETGGFFTCSLSLDCSDWNYCVEPVGEDRRVGSLDYHVPDSDEIRWATEHTRPIPQVALKVLYLIEEGDSNAADIAAEIQKDQVLCARTLQLCNSPLFHPKQPIESLNHALAYLGEDRLLRFVISAAVSTLFDSAARGYSLCMGGLFHHAVGTAITAERIARFTGAAPSATAYTAGLLHDIGKVVLDQYIVSAYPLFYRRLNQDQENFTRIEMEVLGTDHTRVGDALAGLWCFPDSLREAICHHHEPENALGHPELVHMVHLSDLIMSRFQTGLELERLDTNLLESRLNRIGLHKEQFSVIVDLIPTRSLVDRPGNLSETLPNTIVNSSTAFPGVGSRS
jgi:putative nucleotidyltransferase with HDIG domain